MSENSAAAGAVLGTSAFLRGPDGGEVTILLTARGGASGRAGPRRASATGGATD